MPHSLKTFTLKYYTLLFCDTLKPRKCKQQAFSLHQEDCESQPKANSVLFSSFSNSVCIIINKLPLLVGCVSKRIKCLLIQKYVEKSNNIHPSTIFFILFCVGQSCLSIVSEIKSLKQKFLWNSEIFWARLLPSPHVVFILHGDHYVPHKYKGVGSYFFPANEYLLRTTWKKKKERSATKSKDWSDEEWISLWNSNYTHLCSRCQTFWRHRGGQTCAQTAAPAGLWELSARFAQHCRWRTANTTAWQTMVIKERGKNGFSSTSETFQVLNLWIFKVNNVDKLCRHAETTSFIKLPYCLFKGSLLYFPLLSGLCILL